MEETIRRLGDAELEIMQANMRSAFCITMRKP